MKHVLIALTDPLAFAFVLALPLVAFLVWLSFRAYQAGVPSFLATGGLVLLSLAASYAAPALRKALLRFIQH